MTKEGQFFCSRPVWISFHPCWLARSATDYGGQDVKRQLLREVRKEDQVSVELCDPE